MQKVNGDGAGRRGKPDGAPAPADLPEQERDAADAALSNNPAIDGERRLGDCDLGAHAAAEGREQRNKAVEIEPKVDERGIAAATALGRGIFAELGEILGLHLGFGIIAALFIARRRRVIRELPSASLGENSEG